MRTFLVFAAAISTACAQAGSASPDAPGIIVADAEPIGGRVDADPGAPDAEPKVDAAPVPDAMPHVDASPPDAAPPPPPDATPGTPDAAPLPPDAAPSCTVMQIDVLANGSFDSGVTGWTESSSGGYALINATADLPTAPQSGTYAAWLGGYDSGNDQLYQTVTIPAGTTALRLTGYRIIGTEEAGGVYDHLYFRIRNAGGTILETFQDYTNADTVAAWTAFDLPVSMPYAGQSIQLYVQATTDGSLPTGFLLDTLRLEATVCL